MCRRSPQSLFHMISFWYYFWCKRAHEVDCTKVYLGKKNVTKTHRMILLGVVGHVRTCFT
uniref:Uncharacterized protein n=1 Tax=Arundo donax TaxID=35708 RepID=A0A0A8ZVX1_ARUDO